MEKIIKGRNEKGKKVLIVGGIHGNEITPIYTLSNMIYQNYFHVDNLKQLKIINPINYSGLRNNSRERISENTNDINRMFNNIKVEDVYHLKDELNNSDVVIDLHSSPNCSEFSLIDINEFTMSIKNWCDNSGILTAFRYSSNNTIKNYCIENGIMAITLEINGMNKIDFKSSYKAMDLINNLLKNIEQANLYEKRPNVKELYEIKTYKEGLIENLSLSNGEFFNKNELIFSLKNIETLKSELYYFSDFSGHLITSPTKSYFDKGETVCLVQPLNNQ